MSRNKEIDYEKIEKEIQKEEEREEELANQ